MKTAHLDEVYEYDVFFFYNCQGLAPTLTLASCLLEFSLPPDHLYLASDLTFHAPAYADPTYTFLPLDALHTYFLSKCPHLTTLRLFTPWPQETLEGYASLVR